MKKYYVYMYINPATSEPFYIGKGCGRRYRRHLFETYENTTNKFRWSIIASIKNKNLEPIIKIVKNNLSNNQALKEESMLIKKYGMLHNNTGILSNIVEGGKQPPPGVGNANWKTNNPSKYIKGLTYEQIYGHERSQKIKQMRSNSSRGRKFSKISKQRMSESAKLRNDREYQRKKIHTPHKIFNSMSEAAIYYKIAQGTATYRCQSIHDRWKDWYYVYSI